MDGDLDVILHFWWIAKYVPSNLIGRLEDIRFIQFKNRRDFNISKFTIYIEPEILKYLESMIVQSSVAEEIKTDTID
jgi:hypothetical protein